LLRKAAVIGIGNTLRRDDGIGIVALESLLKFYRREGIDYLSFGPASLDLISKIQDYDSVLLIDGVNAGWPAGEIKISKLCNIEYDLKDYHTSTHEFNLKEIFELSKKFRLKTKVYVAGIQVEDTSYAEGLSFSLSSKKKDIVEEISAFIDKTLCSPH
jgi:hydrogenase maturation protease